MFSNKERGLSSSKGLAGTRHSSARLKDGYITVWTGTK